MSTCIWCTVAFQFLGTWCLSEDIEIIGPCLSGWMVTSSEMGNCLAKVLWTGQTKNCILSVCVSVSPTFSRNSWMKLDYFHCFLPITNPPVHLYLSLLYPFAKQVVHWGPFIQDQDRIFTAVWGYRRDSVPFSCHDLQWLINSLFYSEVSPECLAHDIAWLPDYTK